jgi:hypothetical protein
MDEIEIAKIGKKEEPLGEGWDNIRHQQPIGTNYPPMRVKGADDLPVTGALPWTYFPPPRNRLMEAYYIIGPIVSLVVAIGILIAAFWGAGKILGFW